MSLLHLRTVYRHGHLPILGLRRRRLGEILTHADERYAMEDVAFLGEVTAHVLGTAPAQQRVIGLTALRVRLTDDIRGIRRIFQQHVVYAVERFPVFGFEVEL